MSANEEKDNYNEEQEWDGFDDWVSKEYMTVGAVLDRHFPETASRTLESDARDLYFLSR
jgi:hypothetical protein